MSLRDLHGKFTVEERVVEPAAKSRLYLTSVILVLVGSTVFLAVLADVVNHGGLSEIDKPVQAWLRSGQSEWQTVVMVTLVAMAVSRIYPGYHWPTDVIASVFLALAVLGGVIALDTYRTVRVGSAVDAVATTSPAA